MRLEDKVDVVPEADAFPVGQREKVVVVEHRVEGLDPLGVHVSIADQPRLHLVFFVSLGVISARCRGPRRAISSVGIMLALQTYRQLPWVAGGSMLCIKVGSHVLVSRWYVTSPTSGKMQLVLKRNKPDGPFCYSQKGWSGLQIHTYMVHT